MIQSSYNPFSLNGKRILVTGASSGIGRAISIQCSKMGASLYISGRDEERLNETYSSLHGHGHERLIADLSNSEDVIRMVDNIDCLNGMVNSAGISMLRPFLFNDRADFDNLLEINFHGPLDLSRRLIKGKKILGRGSIVFISSLAATRATSGISMYAASKGALNSIVNVMALELVKKQIRVNSILPGMIRTDLSDTIRLSEVDSEKNERRYPLGYGEPLDVAYAAIYLLSDASKWVTGSQFVIDGGFSVQ